MNSNHNPSLAAVLRIAAVYNIAWGAWQVLAPNSYFDLMGMTRLNHPMVWQGLGMVIGLCGLAYYWASFDYVRHWPIVAIGLLGKVFGPIGYIYNILMDAAPASFGYTLITNDLIWWAPFILMLNQARRAGFPLR
ncbi:MAG: alkyl hydroperoxide reductase [Candidatus Kapabacteria bacterium]|nr:alkyl hydroperoxide reductase [Candidatus Kapabacteria bacterium]